jgi:quercetin dioxygenase-like cupin family protein
MPFFDPDSGNTMNPLPGIAMRAVWGERMMMCFFDLEPGAALPAHSHPHEQVGMGISGVIDLTIGDETRTIRPGDSYCIPPGVTHRAVASAEGARVLDVFSPVREEYKGEPDAPR